MRGPRLQSITGSVRVGLCFPLRLEGSQVQKPCSSVTQRHPRAGGLIPFPCVPEPSMWEKLWLMDLADQMTCSQSHFSTLVSSTDVDGKPCAAGQPPSPSRPTARAATVAKWNFCGRKTFGSSSQSWLSSSRLLCYYSSVHSSPPTPTLASQRHPKSPGFVVILGTRME